MSTMRVDDLKLTTRQLECWRMIAEGMNVPEIAKALFRTKDAIECRRTVLYRKLGVNNQVQATRMAVARGVVSAEWEPSAVGVS